MGWSMIRKEKFHSFDLLKINERDMFYQVQNGKVFARDFYQWVTYQGNHRAFELLKIWECKQPNIEGSSIVDYS